MRGMVHTENVQVTAVVPLPAKMKRSIIARARRLLSRHRFGNALMHLYIKNANSRVGCSVNLFTDNGRYHTYVEDWDVRRACESAFETIDIQIVKYLERRADMARASLYT